MVDHQVDRGQRIDLLGVAAQGDHGVAHRGEIDHGGHAGEILHQHAGRAESDLAVAGAVLQPLPDRLDVVDGDAAVVFRAQQILQQHAQGQGQLGEIAQGALGSLQGEIVVGFAADGQAALGFQGIVALGHFFAPRWVPNLYGDQ